MAWNCHPVYRQPPHAQLVHNQPVYGQQPVHGHSPYGQAVLNQSPMYGQPVYHQPVYCQPVYVQPIYGQPMYGQPVYCVGKAAYNPPMNSSNSPDSRYVEWESTHFAEGSFRYAIRGMWIRHPTKAGQKCVGKYLKQSFTWKPNDWDATIKMHNDAQALAKGFNDFSKTNRSISFNDVTLMQYKQTNPNGPKLGEYIVIEDYLEGEFIKWCNNYGYWNERAPSQSMPAFMHWSWFHTKGQRMIGDLQGIQTVNQYKLTDPALLSLTGEYGCTDMGIEGMVLMLLNHKCNAICKNLPKPSVQQILSCLSPNEVPMVEQMLQNMLNNTTYAWQIKLSPEALGRVKLMLEFVANN